MSGQDNHQSALVCNLLGSYISSILIEKRQLHIDVDIDNCTNA